MNSRPQAIKLLSPDDVIRINRKLGERRICRLLPRPFTLLQTAELLRLLDFGLTDTSQK